MKNLSINCLVIAISILFMESCKTVDQKNDNEAKVTLLNGPTIKFSSTKAKSTLTSWAKELSKHGGSVTHFQAVNREREVVQNINSGLWDVAAYDEYQRMSSVMGNVDSAKLLIDYGIKQTIVETIKSKVGLLSKLFKSISTCNTKEFKLLVNTHDDDFHVNMAAEDGTSLLMVAAYFNCVDILKQLFEVSVTNSDEVDVNGVGMHGMNAFLVAAARGHSDVIQLLNVQHADLTTRHKFNGNTALHMAAEMDQADAISALCALSIDTQAVTNSGSNALHIAASSNASALSLSNLVTICHLPVDGLLHNDTTALYLASQHGYLNAARALLELGSDVSFSMPAGWYQGGTDLAVNGELSLSGSPINTEPGNGAEAIHVAAENGHSEVVRLLVTQGDADINSLSMSVTPLHLAAQYNRLEVARVLLELEADVDSVAYTDKATPLYYAVGHNHLELAQLLLSHGADVHKRQYTHAFPLFYASITSSDGQMVRLLLQHRARINDEVQGSDSTSLLAAVQHANLPAVQVLLSHGSDGEEERVNLFHQTHDHFTVLHYAALSNRPAIMSLLVTALHQAVDRTGSKQVSDFLAFVNTPTLSDGVTALHYAAMKGHTESVLDLLALGAQVDSRLVDSKNKDVAKESSYGATVLYTAVDGNHLDTVYALLHSSASPDLALSAPSHLTPLLLATEKGLTDMIELLLTGQCVTCETKISTTVVNLVKQRKGIYTLHKADPNLGVPKGKMQSPLLFAVSRGLSKAVKHLLANGAFCNVLIATSRDSVNDVSKQDTLIDIARKRRDFDTLQVLSSFKQCDADDIRRRQREQKQNGEF